jgi:hypothetical protein
MLIGRVWVGGQAALPANYQVQFENASVRVTSVRYAPREKVAAHAHTPYPSAYVYLNDGPPVVFSHVGGKAATRSATKAGAFRVYKGLEEIHEVENTGDTPSEFLRVELKTVPAEPATFWGKFERPSATRTAVVHFNHPQVRISRVWVSPGEDIDIGAGEAPALVIALADGTGLKTGATRWLDAGSNARFTNTASRPVDLLRFDLRTPPRATR